jgi:hypothetical protein
VDSDSIVNQLLQLDKEEAAILIDDDTSLQMATCALAIAEACLCAVHDDAATDPNTVHEAKHSQYWSEWLAAMHEELESLRAKGVYEEVSTVPPSRKPVHCKWVLHIKRDKTGAISRFKAQLVAKGFTQILGQDFTFTFAPVARWDSIRTLLCLSAIHDFELRQLDVKTAYLNGPLEEEIYMKAPDGFNYSCPYWRLRKGLYGLRQAGRQWYLTLHDAYTDLGYTRCESDWSVYTRRTPSSLSLSATSVDDILLASNSKAKSDTATAQINDKFTITDSGDAEWILGCRITRCRSKHLLMIDQEQFTTSILRDYGFANSKPNQTPCPKDRLTSEMCPKTDAEREEVAKFPYCTIVGKCMYLAMCTRPDIAYAVCKLARFMSNFGPKHCIAVKHLLRYLNCTRSHGIIYSNLENLTPIFRSFADSDWGMSDSRKSVSGYIIECAGGPIAWSSKQQAIVALSSCEAEYLACTHCARQIIWLRSLFNELGYPQNSPSIMYCDNQGTVACTHDPHSHSRMKHIDIRAHFIRSCVNRKIIDVHYIPGIHNPADLFTKPLEKIIHFKWLERIRLDISQGRRTPGGVSDPITLPYANPTLP